jgi:hypothetical protein
MGFKQNDRFNHTYWAIVRCRIGSALFLKHGLPQELILLSCPEPAIFFYFN